MALNTKPMPKRPIGPAMQWTRRGGRRYQSKYTPGNIDIDFDAYRTTEPKQPGSNKDTTSSQSGNPVAYKKRKRTGQQDGARHSTQNWAFGAEGQNPRLNTSQQTAWDYYSGGAHENQYAQWAQNGKQHQANTQSNDVPLWNSQPQTNSQHRTAIKTKKPGAASQYFTDSGALKPNSTTSSSSLSLKQYVLPFVVVAVLILVGFLASIG